MTQTPFNLASQAVDAVPTITIGIVHSHKIFREALAKLLSSNTQLEDCKLSVVLEASSGLELAQKLKTQRRPSVIILGLNMPKMNGFDIAEWLKENASDVKIIVLTSHNTLDIVDRMTKLGVKGFVSKDAGSEILIRAIYVVNNNQPYISNNIVEKVILPNPSQSKTLNRFAIVIDYHEMQLLKGIASEMTYKEIAKVIHRSVRSIDGDRHALCEKLGVKSRTGLILYALRHGIISLDGNLVETGGDSFD